MPLQPTIPLPARKPSTRRLIALAVLVLLAHGLLLGGVSSAVNLLSGGRGAAAQPGTVSSFVARTIAADSPADQAPATPKRIAEPPVRPRPPAATQTANAVTAPPAGAATTNTPPDAPPTEAAPATSPVTVAQSAVEAPPAPSTPAVPPTPVAPGTQAAAVGAETAQAHPVAYPPPVRLLYDGRGEEKGYIKYAASGELLWLPQDAQYSARLELSALMFRVRTWTSKGELTSTGLAPLRFGDKPRGAELATHFQRDKGIISFSANNPDVPLQAGAQDKLTSFLQLSALLAGAPERYPAGSSIRFQAADAHRAEVWDFKVGATELLDLPGGPTQALKLSKSPTVEFDQGIEVWLAPAMHYLPVRLRITEANGAFADLLWRKTENPQ